MFIHHLSSLISHLSSHLFSLAHSLKVIPCNQNISLCCLKSKNFFESAQYARQAIIYVTSIEEQLKAVPESKVWAGLFGCFVIVVIVVVVVFNNFLSITIFSFTFIFTIILTFLSAVPILLFRSLTRVGRAWHDLREAH